MSNVEIPANFALEELFATLREQPEQLEGFYSTKKLCKMLGRSRPWVQERIALAKEQGMLEVAYETFESISGRRAQRPVYKFNTNGAGES